MATPRVSVLIPVFNRESLLEPCVESALRQTFGDIEVVVSDNASTDGTWDLCRMLARRDPRVRVFRNASNLGPVANWRACVTRARAPLVKLLFSDDTLMPTYLEKTAPLLDDPSVGLVSTAADVSGRIAYRWRDGRCSSLAYVAGLMRNGQLPVSPCAALLRTDDLRRNLVEFGRHGIGPDLFLLLRTARAYRCAAHLSEPLVFFRDHPGSLSREKQSELVFGYACARARFVLSLLDFSRARTTHT